MDPKKPALEIYYGKYLDEMTNQIPAEHIDPQKNRSFGKSIEPGKPNFPTSDDITITLENLDSEGNERYPKQWFLDNSKSEDEGAENPFELFFKIYVYGEQAFTGIYSSKSYSNYKEQVNIEITDISGFFDRDEAFLLKPFSFEDSPVFKIHNSDAGKNNISTGTDLEGDSLDQQALEIMVIRSPRYLGTDDGDFTDDYTAHAELRGYNDTDDDSPTAGQYNEELRHERVRYTFVQINDITLLTRLKEQVFRVNYAFSDNVPRYWMELRLVVHHADNGNYTDNGITTLERGRYFSDDQGNQIEEQEKVNVKIWDYDFGLDDDIIIHKSYMPGTASDPTPFLHGAEVSINSSNEYTIELTSDSWVDLPDLVTEALKNRYLNYYKTNANADFFDLSLLSSNRKKAFLADPMMFGWLVEKQGVAQTLVDLSRQLNCYLYVNEKGQIVFHPRDYHKEFTDNEQLPPNSVDMDSAPFDWNSGEGEDGGFETFTVKIPSDIIEINNVKSDEELKIPVDENGVRTGQSVRDSDLELANYRLSDLGVPSQDLKEERKVFRYSPEDSDFPNHSSDLIDEFIPTAEHQAVSFAQTLDWPVQHIYPSLPGQKFESIGQGSYMHRQEDGLMKVYLVMEITRTTDLWKNVTLKKEAEWEV